MGKAANGNWRRERKKSVNGKKAEGKAMVMCPVTKAHRHRAPLLPALSAKLTGGKKHNMYKKNKN